MSRLASPAVGCHLHLVEVQVGDAVETYKATTFDQPLEFSLQGQQSPGSGLGILMLVISTGFKQMLSLRLNDLLKHPYGTEETITVDKQAQKVCIRLPKLDHTLRIWFQHNRDFLVSVCILRKTGFTIEERTSSPPARTDRRRVDKNFKPNRPTKLASLSSLSTTTPLIALPGQARDSLVPCSTPDEDATTPHGNIFDEVLDRLNQTGKQLGVVSRRDSSISARPDGSAEEILIDSCQAFAAKRQSTKDQVTNKFSLRDPSNHEYLDNQATSEISNNNFQGVAMDPPPRRRHHGYFTRSFSLAAGRLGTNVKKEEHSQPVRKRIGKSSTPNAYLGDPEEKIRSSFNTEEAADFRNSMPRRRSLPFLETKHLFQARMRKKQSIKLCSAKKPINAAKTTELRALTAQPICSTSEVLMVLMNASTLDELETKSSFLYKQYEQDIANGRDSENRAAFYLYRLKCLRTSFWMKNLQKVCGSEREAWEG
ncbi:hypothetical protein E4U21_000422 [Claviceps maximensis]|nr:hypothetical protein E4U21_000422 [Claviceps maximensis]